MTIKQEIRLKMYLSVDDFLAKNENLTKALPEFKASLTEFKDAINKIKLIDEQQENIRTGIAKDKRDIKNSLIALAAENSGKVFALAKVSKDKPLMDEVNFSISEVGRMTDVALRTYAEKLFKRIETMLESLAGYGITAETQKQFSETISAYNNSLSKPRVGIAEKREATKELKTLFSTADAILGKIDAILGIIRYNEVKFYEGYKTVRKLVDTNAGVVALKAGASDLSTSEPIKGVIFTFKLNGTVLTKKTAEKGSFYIRNMKPGTYEVAVKKEGYKEKVVTVNINDGERSELSVELEKA
jgi:hypothetical protein